MLKIAKYIILDIVRSKVLLAYTLLLLAISLTIFMSDADVTKGLVSITTVILIIVPLVSIVYATTYYFNAGIAAHQQAQYFTGEIYWDQQFHPACFYYRHMFAGLPFRVFRHRHHLNGIRMLAHA
jgi:hypothetical protein